MRFESTRTHALLDLVVGIILILAPNIFGLAGGAISDFPRILGIIVIVSELTTDNGLSLVRFFSMPAHLAMDMLIAIILAISPWFYINGSTQTAHNWVPQLVLGLLILGNAMVTSPVPDRTPVRAAPVRRTRRNSRSRARAR